MILSQISLESVIHNPYIDNNESVLKFSFRHDGSFEKPIAINSHDNNDINNNHFYHHNNNENKNTHNMRQSNCSLPLQNSMTATSNDMLPSNTPYLFINNISQSSISSVFPFPPVPTLATFFSFEDLMKDNKECMMKSNNHNNLTMYKSTYE